MRRLRSAKLVVALCMVLLAGCGGSQAAHASPLSLANTQPTVVSQQQAHARSLVQQSRSLERVSDRAGLLSSSDRAKLDAQILAVESRTDSQLVLVTLPTIGPSKDVKQYATSLFNQWDIGQNAGERKKGVLILFVKDGGARGKGRIQIAVSRSLNSAVSATWTDGMLEASVLPRLRTQAYGEAFERCIQRLEPRLNRERGDEPLSFDVDTDEVAAYGMAGLLLAAGGISSRHYERKRRTCEACGTVCETFNCGDWQTDIEATTLRDGLRHREITCHKCGSVTVKKDVIPKYDGRRSDGTYYYRSDSSGDGGDGGGCDGGGGGGGDV